MESVERMINRATVEPKHAVLRARPACKRSRSPSVDGRVNRRVASDPLHAGAIARQMCVAVGACQTKIEETGNGRRRGGSYASRLTKMRNEIGVRDAEGIDVRMRQ